MDDDDWFFEIAKEDPENTHILTNDNFDERSWTREGESGIGRNWRDTHLIKYMWMGHGQNIRLKPHSLGSLSIPT